MPSEELYLQDIINSIDDVARFLKGIAEPDFIINDILQNAVLMKLVVIGEAANRVSEDLRKRHPEIEWRPIIGFRNIAVHAYFSLKWEVVWETATGDLQILHEQINHILQADFPDFELRTK
jgi:uncharacterized protein with HEPN domain